MKKLILYILGLIPMILALGVSCPTNTTVDISVDGVYYFEDLVPHYYLGVKLSKGDHYYELNGVDSPDWKSNCHVDGNQIIWGGDGESPLTISVQDIGITCQVLLQLQNPYDPTNDAGKKIYFNTDSFFRIPNSGSGEGAGGYDMNARITDSEKVIDFSKFHK